MVETTVRTLQVGDDAPPIALKNSDLKNVTLEDYRGKTVILAFFPAAFSTVCTAELCAFHQHIRDLNEIDANVLGISVDLPYALREFRRSEGISFPLLSDFDRSTIERYGVVDNDFQGYTSGVAQRSIFVIDRKGKITWRWIANSENEHPDYADVYLAAEQIRS